MREEDLTTEYLSRFPTKLRDALQVPKHRNRFLRSVRDEYDEIIVYRGIHRETELDDDDFICNIEEGEKYNHQYNRISIELYAISVNEDPLQIIKSLSIPNARKPALGIAMGKMKMNYGPADFKNDVTHHNWYLYEDEIVKMKERFIVEDVEKLKKRFMHDE